MYEFQFTHPMWGATCRLSACWRWVGCFNSRTPCGVRLLDLISPLALFVSIHAPHVGCDSNDLGVPEFTKTFQFTHPMWGATLRNLGYIFDRTVSIHAPHVGCDSSRLILTDVGGVSIHAPHVGCDLLDEVAPRWRGVSIHAPHVGCDVAENSLYAG